MWRIIVKRQNLSDMYGAHLLQKHHSHKVTVIDDDDVTFNDKISDLKRVLIVGNYYNKCYDIFNKTYGGSDIQFTVFINKDVKSTDKITFIKADIDSGFATWALIQIGIEYGLEYNIAKWLDEYIYGSNPTELTIYFYDGVQYLGGNTLFDKILRVNADNIDQVINWGRRRRNQNLRSIKKTLRDYKQIKVTHNDKEFMIAVIVSNIHIFDTCLLLTSVCDMAMVYHHNHEKKYTIIDIRTTKKSGINANQIIKELFNGEGDGTTYVANICIAGIHYPK
jgi:hypothetical protein